MFTKIITHVTAFLAGAGLIFLMLTSVLTKSFLVHGTPVGTVLCVPYHAED